MGGTVSLGSDGLGFRRNRSTKINRSGKIRTITLLASKVVYSGIFFVGVGVVVLVTTHLNHKLIGIKNNAHLLSGVAVELAASSSLIRALGVLGLTIIVENIVNSRIREVLIDLSADSRIDSGVHNLGVAPAFSILDITTNKTGSDVEIRGILEDVDDLILVHELGVGSELSDCAISCSIEITVV